MTTGEVKQLQHSIDKLNARINEKLDKIEETLYENNENTAVNSHKLDKLNEYEKSVSKNSADIKWLKKLTYTLLGLLIGLTAEILVSTL